VDKSRKDHWALYPAPRKIPVVYEPDPDQPDPKARARQKLPARQIIKTIMVRDLPQVFKQAIVRTYPVPGGDVENVVKELRAIFGDTSQLRVTPIGDREVMVQGFPEDQLTITYLLNR
jgi:hypothetical protein